VENILQSYSKLVGPLQILEVVMAAIESDEEVERVGVELPISRVKKIARADPDVKTVSAEATWLLAAAGVCSLCFHCFDSAKRLCRSISCII
jgi:hypothetical protein